MSNKRACRARRSRCRSKRRRLRRRRTRLDSLRTATARPPPSARTKKHTNDDDKCGGSVTNVQIASMFFASLPAIDRATLRFGLHVYAIRQSNKIRFLSHQAKPAVKLALEFCFEDRKQPLIRNTIENRTCKMRARYLRCDDIGRVCRVIVDRQQRRTRDAHILCKPTRMPIMK
jgi:hypothetical protein